MLLSQLKKNAHPLPAAVGKEWGTLKISPSSVWVGHPSDPSSPQIVILSGTGTTATKVLVSPTSLTFAPQAVGTTSASQTSNAVCLLRTPDASVIELSWPTSVGSQSHSNTADTSCTTSFG